MALYSISQRTTDGTNAKAAWEIRTTTTDRTKILEIGISTSSGTASVFGVGTPGAIGVTPTTPQTVLGEDDQEPAGTITVATAWGTGPTAPTNFFRRGSFQANTGAAIVWCFPRGLIIPVSSSIVVWNLAANDLVDVWAMVDE